MVVVSPCEAAQVPVADPLHECWLGCWNAIACSQVAYHQCPKRAFSEKLHLLVGSCCQIVPRVLLALVADWGACEAAATSVHVAHSSWHWVVALVARVAPAADVAVVNHVGRQIESAQVPSNVCPSPSLLQYWSDALWALWARPASTVCVEETRGMALVFQRTSQASCPSLTWSA